MDDGEFTSKEGDVGETIHRSVSILEDHRIIVDKNHALLTDLRLPFTAVSSGIGKLKNCSEEGLPDVCNPEMFTLEQLYCLRSELIQMKAFIEQQSNIQTGLFHEISQAVRNYQTENSVEREVRRIRFQKTEPKPVPPPELKKHETAEDKSKQQTKKLKDKHSHHHKDKHHNPDEPKPITSDTIWDTTDRFFKPIKTPNYFDRYLIISRPTYDMAKLQEPLGTHYSITFPKLPSFQNDSLKAQLKMPSPPFSDSTGSGNTHIHKRLIAAIVNIVGDIEDSNLATSDGEFNPGTDKLDEGEQAKNRRTQDNFTNLSRAQLNALPVGSRIGNSAYGQLDFEKRLQLELDSLGIASQGQTVMDMNYPVVRYLSDKVAQQRLVCDQANRCRRMIEQYVALGQRKFADVVKRDRDWNSALSLYLAQEQKDKGTTKKKKKSQSTKAIKEEEYSVSSSNITSNVTSDNDE